jgi:hypothetical protein
MTNRAKNDADPDGMERVAPSATAEHRLRPIGAWVVAGFLLFATLTMWTVVSLIFYAYS